MEKITKDRLERLFESPISGGFMGRILNVYCTAGFPELGSTIPVMKA